MYKTQRDWNLLYQQCQVHAKAIVVYTWREGILRDDLIQSVVACVKCKIIISNLLILLRIILLPVECWWSQVLKNLCKKGSNNIHSCLQIINFWQCQFLNQSSKSIPKPVAYLNINKLLTVLFFMLLVIHTLLGYKLDGYCPLLKDKSLW